MLTRDVQLWLNADAGACVLSACEGLHDSNNKNPTLRAAFCVVMVLGIAASPVFAQSFLSSIESIIGPVVPSCGLASTFRSEVGTALSVVKLDKLQLSDGQLPAGVSSVALQHLANLDETPLRFDAYVNFRLWRMGARAQWIQFEEEAEGVGIQ